MKEAGLTRYTEHTITSFDELDRQLDSIARDGYVVSIEELEHGLTAVAAPIRDHTGTVIAALSVSGPVYRLTEDRARETRTRGGGGGRVRCRTDGLSGLTAQLGARRVRDDPRKILQSNSGVSLRAL